MYCPGFNIDLKSQLIRTHLEVIGFGVRLIQEPRQVDVEERRDVPEVEQTNVAEVYRFLVKQPGRNHPHGDHVPRSPHGLPISNGGDGQRVRGRNLLGRFEERVYECRPLEEPQGVTGGGVHPTLDRAKIRVREQGEGIPFAELFQP